MIDVQIISLNTKINTKINSFTQSNFHTMSLLFLVSASILSTVVGAIDLSACKQWSLSVPGPVDFFSTGDMGAFPLERLGPYTVNTSYTGGKVGFTKNATRQTEGWPNLARGTTGNRGDFGLGVIVGQPSVECVNATNAAAAEIDAMPCDYFIQDGALVNFTETYQNGVFYQTFQSLVLTNPGMYCSSVQDSPAFSLSNLNLTINANGSKPFFFRGNWQQWSGDIMTLTNSGAITAINLQGGITSDQVYVRTPKSTVDTSIAFSTQFPSWHTVGNVAGSLLTSANVTFISSIPMVIAGNVEVGRILFTSNMTTDASDAYIAFHGTYDVILTADTTETVIPPTMSSTGGVCQCTC